MELSVYSYLSTEKTEIFSLPIQLSSGLNYKFSNNFHCTHCQAQDQILAFTLLHQVEKKILIVERKLNNTKSNLKIDQ